MEKYGKVWKSVEKFGKVWERMETTFTNKMKNKRGFFRTIPHKTQII